MVVDSAVDMLSSCEALLPECDIFIACAAVADYRPERVAEQKLKKQSSQTLQLSLIANPDILADVARLEKRPFTIGFAAETEQLEAQAENKRKLKGLDLIAANQVGGKQGGFESAENALLLLWEGGREWLPMMAKDRLARELATRIVQRYRATRQTDHAQGDRT